MFKVMAWEIRSNKFDGLVYDQKILLDKMAEADWYKVEAKWLYREHRPMSHMTYIEL